MPSYEWRCPVCPTTLTVTASVEERPQREVCPCGADMRRVWGSFGFIKGALSFEPHYNKSVGGVVHTQAEHRSELTRKSDEASARTGIPHDFQPIDYRDAPGVDPEFVKKKGLEHA